MIKSNDSHTIEVFEKMPIAKALFSMAVPTIFGQLIVLIYSLADTFFIGQTGDPNKVAAVSLLLPIYNLSIPLANMTGLGGGTLISALIAKGEGEEARKVSCASFYICILIAFLYASIFLIFMEPLLHILGASSETYDFAKSYAMLVIVCGAIPVCLNNTIANLVRSCGFSKEASFGITLGGVLNIFLDPLFMFVICKKGNEVLGAATATLISNVISMIYFITLSIRIRKRSAICYDLRIGTPTKRSILKLFAIGIPSSMMGLFFDIDYIILDKLMAMYGEVQLAAIGIVLKAERFPVNIGVGICQGMVPIVAYNKSAHNYKRMNGVIKLSMLSGAAIGFTSLVIYQIFAPQIIRFFINDTLTIAAGTVFLRLRSIASTFMFLSFFFNYIFQAFGEGKYCLFCGIYRWCLLNIPLLFILNYFFGMYGLASGQFVADIISFITFLTLFIIYEKRHNLL